MPNVKTTVSLTSADLSHFELDPKKLHDLEKSVKTKLSGLHVSSVSAEIVGGGKGVKFVLEAPAALDPPAVKKALKA
jgi:hypothetical protein